MYIYILTYSYFSVLSLFHRIKKSSTSSVGRRISGYLVGLLPTSPTTLFPALSGGLVATTFFLAAAIFSSAIYSAAILIAAYFIARLRFGSGFGSAESLSIRRFGAVTYNLYKYGFCYPPNHR